MLGRCELEVFSFVRSDVLPPTKLAFDMSFELTCATSVSSGSVCKYQDLRLYTGRRNFIPRLWLKIFFGPPCQNLAEEAHDSNFSWNEMFGTGSIRL